MDKEQLKKKLEEVKVKIKTNSKDAHFADTLIDEILSIKGQLDVEPTIVHIEEKDVVQKLDGDTFSMYITSRGDAVYHVKGGYTIVADYRMNGLSEAIAGYVLNNDVLDTLSEEERELYELDMEASTFVLNAPMIAFSDENLKFDVATLIVKYLKDYYDDAMGNALEPEDGESARDFEEKVSIWEDLKEQLEDSVK